MLQIFKKAHKFTMMCSNYNHDRGNFANFPIIYKKTNLKFSGLNNKFTFSQWCYVWCTYIP